MVSCVLSRRLDGIMCHSPARPVVRTPLLFLGSVALLALAGCAMGTPAPPDPISFTVGGHVHGGQQGVVGAQVQLYDAGNSGNGSAATAMLSTPVVTGADGAFSVSSGYTCASQTDQVYIVATGGNPGLGSGGNNPALVMMTALGNCSDLSTISFVTINEVTTAAAAWALAPFTQSYTQIGASATNSLGLTNAFLDANLIADRSLGTTATLPANLSTEAGKIYALADALASCVNSDGGSACTPLFTAATPSGGSAPANTFDAALNIVKNPGNNVAGVFAAIGPQPPFPTSLTQAPSDWTLSLAVTGGGLNAPQALGLDSQSNLWVAGTFGVVSVFNAQGTPLNAAGYTSSFLGEDYGLAVDPDDNVWVTAEEIPTHGTKGGLVKILGVSSGSMGTLSSFSDGSIDYPLAVAADSNGNLLIANNGNGSITVLNPSGPTYTLYQNPDIFPFPFAIAPDTSHGIWVADASGGDIYLTHVDSNGNLLKTVCCGNASGLALDASSNVWVSNYKDDDPDSDGSIEEVASDGTVLKQDLRDGGILGPSAIAVDAAQTVWVTNYHSPEGQPKNSFSELSGSASSNPGTALSPSTGFGLDADLQEPHAVAVDASGNIWIANAGGNNLVMFFGMGAPTKTPKSVLPVAP